MPELEVAGTNDAGPPSGSAGIGRLVANAVIGNGRYRIESLQRRATIGEIYRAVDAAPDAGAAAPPVSIYLFDAALVAHARAADALGRVLALTAGFHHKNLLRNGPLQREGAHTFALTELVEGNSLRELLARKLAAGSVFSPKGAYNVLAHVCNALAHAHGAGAAHGLLHPGNVFVNKAGRVTVAELGFGAVVPVSGTVAAPFAAPELASPGARPSPAADLFSAGAILYELLTGVQPAPGAAPPSKITLGLPAAVDHVVGRAVASAPSQRFPDAVAFKRAMQQALDGGATAVAVAGPNRSKRPSLSQQLSGDQQAALRGAGRGGPPASAAADLSDTTEKWLVSKDRLDYGPFALAQLRAQISADEILPGHVVVDNETGERCPAEEHPLLSELVEHARQLRDDRRRANAEVQHAKTEKRRGTTLYAVIAAGVIALGGAAYLVVGAMSSASDDGTDTAFSALEESQLEATITFPTQQEQAARSAKRRAKRSGGGAVAVGGDGFDEALDLGDASEGGEGERLDSSQINPVISSHGGALGRCLTSTGTRSANVEFIVRGNGRVSDVRVNGNTGSPVTNCIGGVMRKMQFPSFDGARTRAEFQMGF